MAASQLLQQQSTITRWDSCDRGQTYAATIRSQPVPLEILYRFSEIRECPFQKGHIGE